MTEVEVGDLLVVRFAPMNVRKLTEAAQDEADACAARGDPEIFSISTFGLVRASEGDTIDGLVERIAMEAPVQGRNVWVTSRRALEAAGFSVHLSEPPPHHYDVVLGNRLDERSVEQLFAVLEPGKRRNPAWKK